jgi:RND family efflux transporter MFP subunit
MPPLRNVATLFFGLTSWIVLGAVAVADDNASSGSPAVASGPVIVLDELATMDWIEISDVAALREGVIKRMELNLGMPAFKDKPIGYLHQEIAELSVNKQKILAENTAAIEKGLAAKEVATQVVARNERLNQKRPGLVSEEEVAKALGELKVADAQTREAMEQKRVNEAELELANQILKEHTIVAPFDGIIVKRYKNPGESVRANEAVVRLGNLARLCANAYVPLEYATRVKEGQLVEIQPRLTSTRGREPLPIERKSFQGRITFVDPQIQPVAETAVRIRAEFDNPDFELRPGLKVQMKIYLGDEVAARIPSPAAR